MGLLLLQGASDLNPRELFANGEQGLWLDPSDFSTMWQDSGKTTPVTAAGDPVGYISDKSGRGNDAYQTTSASRPTLARIPSSGRRNLLNESERFDQASWTKSGGAITANAIANPVNGAIDADLFTENSSTSTHYIDSSSRTFAATAHTISVYAKTNGRRYLTFQGSGLVFGVSVASFDLENGTVSSFSAGTTANIESLGDGWYRCAWTVTTLAATGVVTFLLSDVSGTYSRSYTGDGVSGVYLWGAQLETGSSPSNYQKAGSTFDVSESGFPDLYHLVFDGSDDSLVTNSVDFSGTDEMTVIAGVRKLSDAARGMVVELSANTGTNAGSFLIAAPDFALNDFGSYSRGSAVTSALSSAIAAPATRVLSFYSDISQDSLTQRINGTDNGSSSSDQGTGNFGNYQLYIGRRGSSSLPFNGHLYQLIIRGKTTPTGKLLEAERFVGRKTGVSF